MNHRAFGFVALLAVIGVSIVFGMVIGGKLNAPQVVLAAPRGAAIELAPATSGTPGYSFADIVELAMPAVVSVTSTQLQGQEEEEEQPRRGDPFRFFFGDPPERDPRRRDAPAIGEGSGFIISSDGYILTNNHVVEGADRVRVGLQTGRVVDAEVIGADPSIDLALLKVDMDEDLPHLPLGSSTELRVGEWVIAIGNPLEYDHTVTVGVVSAKERRVPIGGTDTGVVTFIQTDAAINFGNSGGPLLDSGGNVIGINTAITRRNFAEGIGFALPIDQARGVIDQLRDKGYVTRGFIGITMNQDGLNEAAAEIYGLPDTRGVIIQSVHDGGPADEAGLRKEDIVRKIDGSIVRDNMDLIAKISSHRPGDAVELEVFRGGQTLTLKATLVDRNEGLQAQQGDSGMTPPSAPTDRRRDESTGLGITVENLNSTWRERLGLEDDEPGVLVTDVQYDSKAADVGVDRNMLIVGVNDQEIYSVDDWDRALESLTAGDPVKLEVRLGNAGAFKYLRVPEE